MRSREDILIKANNGDSANQAIVEVLLDIRDLLSQTNGNKISRK